VSTVRLYANNRLHIRKRPFACTQITICLYPKSKYNIFDGCTVAAGLQHGFKKNNIERVFFDFFDVMAKLSIFSEKTNGKFGIFCLILQLKRVKFKHYRDIWCYGYTGSEALQRKQHLQDR
jgi:hypothetical protein